MALDDDSRDTILEGEAPTASRTPVAEVLAGRYELLGMLGAGGMGTVYRARDRELDETVALKVLRRELASSAAVVERFKREVKLARRVTHRNVARTFDIGEHQGDRFLTMELVEGEGLGARLARLGRLPVAEAAAIVADVCAGLAAAHAAEVVHRDLKPENVVLGKDGRVVITDFGIARAFAPQADEIGRTAGGVFVGTPAYMAPEQVEGATDLDARADLYAAGCMLFELVSGRVPFLGDSPISVAAARLLRAAPDVRSIVPDVPEGLADVIQRLLARRREDRYATAVDVERALHALAATLAEVSARDAAAPATAARGEPVRTVAVLPLLAPEAELYLADGVTEDLVDLLSIVPELRVRPRGDTARYVQVNRQAREIGRALGVDVVVDGSLRRSGDDVRVTVRLITVADGFQLWARRFDRRAAEVLLVAESAAAAVARALTTRDVRTNTGQLVIDPVAQDLYLRGRHLMRRAWFEWSYEAARLLREAASRAPDDARIAGALAHALARVYGMGRVDLELAREARASIDRALRIDPAQAEARVARGLLHAFQGEGAASVLELRVALDHAPNNVDALDALGRLLLEVGLVAEGRALIDRALAVEPDLVLARVARARSWVAEGDYVRASEDLGPPPPHLGDLSSWLLTHARHALWEGTPGAAEVVAELVARSDLSAAPSFVRSGIEGIVRIALTRTLDAQDRGSVEASLAIDGTFSPRRTSFNAQLRAELFLACGLTEAAAAMLGVADANALVDIVWLDSCPLLAALRGTPEFARVRENTALRVARVLQALETHHPTSSFDGATLAL